MDSRRIFPQAGEGDPPHTPGGAQRGDDLLILWMDLQSTPRILTNQTRHTPARMTAPLALGPDRSIARLGPVRALPVWSVLGTGFFLYYSTCEHWRWRAAPAIPQYGAEPAGSVAL